MSANVKRSATTATSEDPLSAFRRVGLLTRPIPHRGVARVDRLADPIIDRRVPEGPHVECVQAAQAAPLAAQAVTIEELRAQVAKLPRRLNRDSSNSSCPPSKDVGNKKRCKRRASGALATLATAARSWQLIRCCRRARRRIAAAPR